MKIAICDDNDIFLKELKEELEKFFRDMDVLILEFHSGEELLDAYRKMEFHVIILDIEMDGIDGLKTAGQIRKENTSIPIILLTSHRELALQGYEINAFRFLVKPVSSQKLQETLHELQKQIFGKERIMVSADGVDYYLPENDILYLKSENVYVRLVTENRSYLVRKTLKEQFKELGSPFWFQVHRSYIINLNYAVSFDGKAVTMKGNNMVSFLWDAVSAVCLMAEFVMVVRYIFLLPDLGNKKTERILYLAGSAVLCITSGFCKPETYACIFFLMAGTYFAICSTGHRIRGFILVIPVAGLCAGFVNLFHAMLCLLPDFTPEWEAGYEMAESLLTVSCVILFWIFGRNWRRRFSMEKQYRVYSLTERFLLNFISVFQFCCALLTEAVITDIVQNADVILLLMAIAAEALTIMLIAFILRGNKEAYYSAVADLNKRYLDAEISHFQAYQNTQFETRKIRHDMQNHLHCLEHLLNAGDYDGAKAYLHSIGIAVEGLHSEIQTGNSLVDAIVNEKSQIARLNQISIETEGVLPPDCRIEQVDLCTVFANAMDNALEAVKNHAPQDRWILIKTQVQGSYISILFENPASADAEPGDKTGSTSKKDIVNHGFGLLNIRSVAKKYGGDTEAFVEEQEGKKRFVLQVMLQNPFTTE